MMWVDDVIQARYCAYVQSVQYVQWSGMGGGEG